MEDGIWQELGLANPALLKMYNQALDKIYTNNLPRYIVSKFLSSLMEFYRWQGNFPWTGTMDPLKDEEQIPPGYVKIRGPTQPEATQHLVNLGIYR